MREPLQVLERARLHGLRCGFTEANPIVLRNHIHSEMHLRRMQSLQFDTGRDRCN